MKISTIRQLKDRFEKATEEVEVQDKGNERVGVQYDAYEELLYVREGDKEVRLTVSEAKRLKTVLNNLI